MSFWEFIGAMFLLTVIFGGIEDIIRAWRDKQ